METYPKLSKDFIIGIKILSREPRFAILGQLYETYQSVSEKWNDVSPSQHICWIQRFGDVYDEISLYVRVKLAPEGLKVCASEKTRKLKDLSEMLQELKRELDNAIIVRRLT